MDKLRKDIEKIDLEIIKLLNKRFQISKKIAEFKIKNQLNFKDKKREQQLIKKYSFKLKDEQFTRNIFKVIFQKSIRIQNEKHNS